MSSDVLWDLLLREAFTRVAEASTPTGRYPNIIVLGSLLLKEASHGSPRASTPTGCYPNINALGSLLLREAFTRVAEGVDPYKPLSAF